MLKLVLVALATMVTLTVAAATASAAADFVIFKNNTTEDWKFQSQSIPVGTLQPPSFTMGLVNPPGGQKSEFYLAPDRTSTSYTSIWMMSDGTACTFSSSAALNSFGNMQFHSSAVASGPRAAMVKCGAMTPGSNLDGSYDFNQSVSFYSTYLGFAGNDTGTAIAADSAGNTYVTGSSDACGATPGVYVAKMSPAGANLYYVCLFAGTGRSIAVDGAGNAYVVAGSSLAKLNSTGTAFVYNITLSPWDLNSVAVDPAGNAYVTGSISVGGANDVVVGKVNPSATALVYGVSLGGSGDDVGNGIAVDSAGNAYVTGTTQSSDFPVLNALQPALRGTADAFVAKINSTASQLLYSTYLGGDAIDSGNGIAVDTAGNAYVVGTTSELNGVESFPVTPNVAQGSPGGGGDAYVAKVTSLATLGFATYLGGSGAEQGAAIAVDATGAYVTGFTQSTNFPVQGGSQTTLQNTPPTPDAYFTRVTSSGNAFVYSSYLGGNSTDTARGIAVDGSQKAYVVGTTVSTNFPTTVFAYAGGQDAFITKF